MSKDTPTVWDVFNDITLSKDGVGATVPNSVYVQFVLNRGLSNFSDTILIANALNRLSRISGDRHMHYLYAKSAIVPRRRISKWPKKKNDSTVEFATKVASLIDSSPKRTAELIELLSPQHFSELQSVVETITDKGGQ